MSHPCFLLYTKLYVNPFCLGEKLTHDRIVQSEDGSTSLPDWGESIDHTTFEQILEMDDEEEEREFSRSIVYGFFEQAEGTFKKMDSNLYA